MCTRMHILCTHLNAYDWCVSRSTFWKVLVCNMHVWLKGHMYICVCVCKHICMYICIYACCVSAWRLWCARWFGHHLFCFIYIHKVYLSKYIYIKICIYIVHTHTHTHTHTYIYIYIYIYITSMYTRYNYAQTFSFVINASIICAMNLIVCANACVSVYVCEKLYSYADIHDP